MTTLDTIVGLDHALVVLRLKALRHQPEEHRGHYLADIVAKQDGRRIRDLVEAAYSEEKS